MSLTANTPFLMLPPIDKLLTQGGDDRILTDVQSGVNRYGCTPMPDPGLVALGSSTASVISAAAWNAAEQLREHWAHRLLNEPMREVFIDEAAQIGERVLNWLGLTSQQANLPLAASGTDAHRVAAQRIAWKYSGPFKIVMVASTETGSGVSAALLAGLGQDRATIITHVALRERNGALRTQQLIEADMVQHVTQGVTAGQHVILIAIDVSKSGILAPSPRLLAQLSQRYTQQLTVLVDACQLRLAPSTVRGYLQAGYVVMLTGSKFMTGPSFSGALLWPRGTDEIVAGQPDETPNFGLLLRWHAALCEMSAFTAWPESQVVQVIRQFSMAMTEYFAQAHCFAVLETNPLDRSMLAECGVWDRHLTLWSFVLKSSHHHQVASSATTTQIYRQLQEGRMCEDVSASHTAAWRCRFLLGQPVVCGDAQGEALSALRISLSSGLLVTALSSGDRGIHAIIDHATAALEKTNWLLRRL